MISSSAEHPPARFGYARDGRLLCSFGIGEERTRRGEDRDLLLPAFVSEGLLGHDGTEYAEESEEIPHHRRRCPAVIGTHFGLSPPQGWLDVTPMPARTANGTADTFPFDRRPEGEERQTVPDRYREAVAEFRTGNVPPTTTGHRISLIHRGTLVREEEERETRAPPPKAYEEPLPGRCSRSPQRPP
ncbi:hypothetical protein [Streptomyces sp. NPDC014623]|uniref:hypothetical protein n=1 Tax=Streptomyces sp. NPDC014623 TaxID=3364875 RepID=UPI0036F76D17